MKTSIHILTAACTLIGVGACTLSSTVPYQVQFEGCAPEELLKQGINRGSDGPQYWEAKAFPLQVFISSHLDNTAIHAAQWATSHWNEEVGALLFSSLVVHPSDINDSIRSRDAGMVTIRRFSDWEAEGGCAEHAGGCASNYWDTSSGVLTASHISFMDQQTREERGLTGINTFHSLAPLFVHELGHALGLDHDPDTGDKSIMWAAGQPFLEWTIQDIDKQYVLNQYIGSCINEEVIE